MSKEASTQCYFDTVMLLMTAAVSSESYISDILGIYYQTNNNRDEWIDFASDVNSQTVKPGIYTEDYTWPGEAVGSSVHYYGVREEKNGDLTVANGYPSSGEYLDEKYAVGLNVQADHSHGLCQTFALMYYNHDEKKLKPAHKDADRYEQQIAYIKNLMIALKYLQGYTKKHPMVWDPEDKDFYDMITDMIAKNSLCNAIINAKGFLAFLKKEIKYKKNEDLYLHELFKIILNKKYRKNLIEWFRDDDAIDIETTELIMGTPERDTQARGTRRRSRRRSIRRSRRRSPVRRRSRRRSIRRSRRRSPVRRRSRRRSPRRR